jgi:hypothetical protein
MAAVMGLPGMAKKPEPPALSSWNIYKVADHGIGTR